ncbi:MAG: EF-P lysine aminoacylase EpmA [Gammaproteobacteria bacterium]
MTVNWQPTATLTHLRQRADILRKIRQFFYHRGLLEVETPTLCSATVTDPYLYSLSTEVTKAPGETQTLYLQTSPEYCMKRLLAAGSGGIFQLCKAYRDDEMGIHHNPEFTMLEWYQPDFNHHQLMDDMDALLQTVLPCGAAERVTYGELFRRYLAIDPHRCDVALLKQCAEKNNIIWHNAEGSQDKEDKDVWLQLLLSHCIEPHLGQEAPIFIYDYPASQAALARIRDDDPPVAERFEVYFKGIELANGFHELVDAQEQRDRFCADLKKRAILNTAAVPLDEYFLAALGAGLPDCAGVALGVDRLVMLALGCDALADVLAFPLSHA